MTPGISRLFEWLEHENVAAFLQAIRLGEGTSDEGGYSRLFGGGEFEPGQDHPRQLVVRGGYRSTAAGAYQILARTWDDIRGRVPLPDFSPLSQDLAAVFLVWRRGAIEDVIAGRLDAAVGKCNREWASMPGSPYGQPTVTKQQFLDAYIAAGGHLGDEQPPAPVEERSIEEKPMAPFIAAALPAVLSAVPELIKVFGDRDKPVRERNAEAAVKVIEIAQEALGAGNAQEVAERISADPQAAERVREAVRSRWYEIQEVGGGIQAAREHDLKIAEAGIAPWRLPAVWATVALLPLVYLVVTAVVFQLGGAWSEEVRAMVVSAVVAGVLGAVTGYWLGTSAGSARKTDLLAGKG